MPESLPPTVHRAVFLSYASQDRNAARRICEALRSGGVEVWFDQEGGLEHGDEWDAKIRRQIKECLLFIPLISANTQARLEGYFRIEWDLAAERSQGIAQGVPFILPVVIDQTSESEALVPDRFHRVQWMRLRDGAMAPEVLARLLRTWAHRIEALGGEAGRAPGAGSAAKPVSPPAAPSAAKPVLGIPFDPIGRRTPPAPVPAPARPAAPDLAAGAPRGLSRFDNLELGGLRPEAGKREVVKDEAYYVAEADEYFFGGRYELALRSYSKVLEYNAANLDAWTAQVRMLVDLGEFREAKLWVEKALERYPTHPDLLAAKAVVLARTGDLDGALAFSDGAIEERGNTPYVWLARGDVLLAREEARASYCFDQVTTLARGDWVHRWQASRIHGFHGKHALALPFAQQAIELAPNRAVVWLQAGRCQIALGMGGRARESLAQARQLDPECPGLAEAGVEADRISGGASVWRRLRTLFQ